MRMFKNLKNIISQKPVHLIGFDAMTSNKFQGEEFLGFWLLADESELLRILTRPVFVVDKEETVIPVELKSIEAKRDKYKICFVPC